LLQQISSAIDVSRLHALALFSWRTVLVTDRLADGWVQLSQLCVPTVCMPAVELNGQVVLKILQHCNEALPQMVTGQVCGLSFRADGCLHMCLGCSVHPLDRCSQHQRQGRQSHLLTPFLKFLCLFQLLGLDVGQTLEVTDCFAFPVSRLHCGTSCMQLLT